MTSLSFGFLLRLSDTLQQMKPNEWNGKGSLSGRMRVTVCSIPICFLLSLRPYDPEATSMLKQSTTNGNDARKNSAIPNWEHREKLFLNKATPMRAVNGAGRMNIHSIGRDTI